MSASATFAQPYDATEVHDWPLFRPFLLTFLLTASSFLVCGYLWGARGFDLLVVGMGWPHVILGFLFHLNKIIKNEGSQRPAFYLLLTITVAICIFHSFISITTLIYLYFVLHAYRDEFFIYHQRRTGHRFAGRVFTAGVWGIAGGLLVLAGLGQFHFHPAQRTVAFSAAQISSGRPLSATFPPIPNSRGREYYFSFEVANQRGKMAPILSYASAAGLGSGGHMLVNERPWRAKDLEFEAGYENDPSPLEPAPAADRVPWVLGGYPVGQTFRARADNLSSITIPVELKEALPAEMKLNFRIEPAFYVNYPYAYEAGLCLLAMALTLLAIFRVPQELFARFPGLIYGLSALFLFVAVNFILRYIRLYDSSDPQFFAFLVVFHYFSWYRLALGRKAHRHVENQEIQEIL